MLLRDSKYAGKYTYAAAAELAQAAKGKDPHGYRKQFVEPAKKAEKLADRLANR